VPTAVVGGAYALVWTTGVAAYNDPGLDAAGWVAGLAQGILGNVVVATLTFSIAEEIGWRGYLLPRLAPALGTVRGMALTGFLHGVYHLPVIFLTPFYHPGGDRLILVPLFLAAFTVGACCTAISASAPVAPGRRASPTRPTTMPGTCSAA
jgi:membrane protease YdiL (CAAX protease family)